MQHDWHAIILFKLVSGHLHDIVLLYKDHRRRKEAMEVTKIPYLFE